MADSDLTCDAINAMAEEGFPGSRTRCVEIGDGFAVAELAVDEEHIRPGGFVSGPTQFALLDAAFWYGSFVAIGHIEPMALTSELSIRFLRPAQGSVIRCRAVVESAGRRSVVLSGRVWADDRQHKPTATGQGTYARPL